MKKIISAVLCVLLVLSTALLAGCGEKEDGKKAAPEGTVYTITFRTNINTGYDWVYEMDKEGIISIKSEFEPYEPEGLDGRTTFTVKALKKGTVKVKFKRVASFDSEPDAYADYTFKVNLFKKFDEVVSGDSYFNDPPTVYETEEPR